MNSLERYLATLEGKPVDHLARLPILMQFAAEHIGSNYAAFASDWRILVEANLRCRDEFGFDQVSAISDPYREAQGFGAEVKRRILIGAYVLSHGYYDAYYLQAQRIRRLIASDFVAAFKQCDVILGPTSPSTAFKLGEKAADPVQMYLSDIYTIAVNLAGLPGMSIPCGFAGGLPAGLQLIGDYFSEARLLNAAHRYQQASAWHLQRPQAID